MDLHNLYLHMQQYKALRNKIHSHVLNYAVIYMIQK